MCTQINTFPPHRTLIPSWVFDFSFQIRIYMQLCKHTFNTTCTIIICDFRSSVLVHFSTQPDTITQCLANWGNVSSTRQTILESVMPSSSSQLPNGPQLAQMLPNAIRRLQMAPKVSSWLQEFLNGSRRPQVIPASSRRLQETQNQPTSSEQRNSYEIYLPEGVPPRGAQK
jgi:hypothetical protein